MKKLLFAAFAALSLAACNKELGPEYTTAAEVGKIVMTPSAPAENSEVTVTAPITSLYGLHAAQLAYQLNDDPSTAKTTMPVYYTKENTSVTFTAVIPAQKAGTKVTFQVHVVTPYSVLTFSELQEYTVLPSLPTGGEGEE